MKYYITGLVALLCAAGMYSCKKDKSNNVAPPIDSVIYPDYMAMKPGNYWIYEEYKNDTGVNGLQPQNIFDSCYVEKDTMIGDKTYHKYCQATYLDPGHYDIFFLRDSLSYVVNNFGSIYFSSQNFTDTFRKLDYYNPAAYPDTIPITEQMGFRDEQVTVGAGTFTTSTFRRILHFGPGYPFGPTREYDHRYAAGVGLIVHTTAIYTAVTYSIEQRLVRYHVQ